MNKPGLSENITVNNVKPLCFTKTKLDLKRNENVLGELYNISMYSLFLDASFDPFIAISMKGKIMDVNKAAELAIGISRSKLIGSSFSNYFTKPQNAKIIYMNVLSKIPVNNYPLSIVHTSGIITDVVINAVEYIDKNGNVSGVFAVARDITESKIIEDIKNSLMEKEIQLREIQHRVKNNMSIIIGLLNLQASFSDSDKIIDEFQKIENRILSMSKVHELLCNSENLKDINMKKQISSLVNAVYKSYSRQENDISYTINVKDINLETEKATSLSLIINELFSNALKYAFPDGKKGEIRIDMKGDEKVGYKLIVSDNGIGLNDGFDINNSESLGLQLVNLLVKQLHGEMKITGKNGMTITIIFQGEKY